MEPDLEIRAAALLRRVLGLSAAHPAAELHRERVPEWDSLRHISLMLELQKEFGVRFSAAEIMALDSLAKIVEALARM